MSLLDSAKKAFEDREAERQKKRTDEDRKLVKDIFRSVNGRLPEVELTEDYEYELGVVKVKKNGRTWDSEYKAVFFAVDGVVFRAYQLPRSYSYGGSETVLEVKGRRGWSRVYSIADIHEAVAKPKKPWWSR